MSIFDGNNLKKLFWGFPSIRIRPKNNAKFDVDGNIKFEEEKEDSKNYPESKFDAVPEKKEEERETEQSVEDLEQIEKQNKRITGYDVTYIIPDDMRRLVVQIQASNGRFINEYTLTNYLDIRPGQRLRIKVKT